MFVTFSILSDSVDCSFEGVYFEAVLFPSDINKALNNYSKKRIKRIHQLDQVSRLNEKVYHLEQRVLRKILFVVLRCLTRFSPNLFFKRLDWIYNYKG